MIRCLALTLTPPRDTHTVLLGDLARRRSAAIVRRPQFARLQAGQLPVVPVLYPGPERTLAAGLAPMDPPLTGEPELLPLRRGIYGVRGVRPELGASSRARIELRLRHARKLLADPAAPHGDTGIRPAAGRPGIASSGG